MKRAAIYVPYLVFQAGTVLTVTVATTDVVEGLLLPILTALVTAGVVGNIVMYGQLRALKARTDPLADVPERLVRIETMLQYGRAATNSPAATPRGTDAAD